MHSFNISSLPEQDGRRAADGEGSSCSVTHFLSKGVLSGFRVMSIFNVFPFLSQASREQSVQVSWPMVLLRVFQYGIFS
jgi:hypothetical protein